MEALRNSGAVSQGLNGNILWIIVFLIKLHNLDSDLLDEEENEDDLTGDMIDGENGKNLNFFLIYYF